jgi:hypothetical protein
MVETKQTNQNKQPKLIGFNFTKINVEKNPNHQGEIKINSDIKILNVDKEKIDIMKQEALKIDFEFVIDYTSLGMVSIQGFLVLLIDAKMLKDALKNWKDKKALDNELQIPTINLILQKSTLRALQLEEEIGLPLHMPMPTAQKKEKE